MSPYPSWFLCVALAVLRTACAGTPAPDPVTPKNDPPAIGNTAIGEPSKDTKPPAPPPKSLYVRVGAATKIAEIADEFVERLTKNTAFAGNEQVKKALTEVSRPALKFYVTTLLCQICRGPEVYGGQPIHEIYLRLKLSDDDWKALMEDFDKALEPAKLSPDDRKDLLTEVGGIRGQLADVVARIFEDKGVFLVVPAGWERIKSEAAGTLLHALGPKPANGGERAAMLIGMEEFSAGLDLTAKEYMKAIQLQMSKSLASFRVTSTQSLSFKNDPVEALACQYKNDRTEISSEVFFLVKNRHGYMIQFMGPKDSFDGLKPVFNDVLRSLRID